MLTVSQLGHLCMLMVSYEVDFGLLIISQEVDLCVLTIKWDIFGADG